MAGIIESKRLSFLLSFIILVLLFSYSFSKADFIPLTTDTLKVGGGTYANDTIYVNPGDIKVPVTIYLRNTFDVAGFTLRSAYDSTILCPSPPVPDSCFRQPSRSLSLPIFGGNFTVPGEIYFAGICFFNPYTEVITTGRGPIVEFYFNIKCNAPEGYYSIRLEDDSLDNPDNCITDAQGTHVYLPVLVNGTICVGSGPAFLLGNANGDTQLSVSDVIYIINYLFKGGPPSNPLRASDVNSDTQNNVGDVIYLINYLFKGGPAPIC